MIYLGDIAEDTTVSFCWSSNDGNGGSITRATDGTIKVRRHDDGTDCTGTSVTDTEDTPDTGIHECKIDTSDNANYTIGDDYTVWLDGAVIDGETVNASLANFSIENRFTNVQKISGDATAADNLELQYDTTGLSGDTFPSTQAAVGNLTSGSAAINTTAKDSPNGFVITTGLSEANDEDSTHALDGTTHDLEDDTAVTDAYYIFDVGGNGVPVSVTWQGYVNAQGDTYTFYAYNWTGTPAWEQIGSRAGVSGSTIVTDTFALTTAHVGTGANIGLVHFRIYSADGELIATDRILCSYAVVAQSVGYAEGAIWVDSAGTVGSEVHVNGIASNPCPWANALVVNAALGLNKFHVANGNTVTLAATADNYTLYGDGWNLALGSQSIDDIAIIGAHITGIGTAAAANHPHFTDCSLGAVTLPPSVMRNCGVGEDAGAFTAGGAGNYIFHGCFSQVSGSGVPSLTFSGLGSATGINNRAWSGGSSWTLDSDCTVSHEILSGGAQSFTTGGADVEVRGIYQSLTLVLSGAGTVQAVGTTGPVTISGTATTTVNLYGHIDSLADTSVNTTVNKPSMLLEQFKIDSASASGGLDIDNSNGPAIHTTGSTMGVVVVGEGTTGLAIQGVSGGMAVNASGDDASAIIISADGSNGAEKGIEITTGGGGGDLVLGDDAVGSINAANNIIGNITGNLSGTVGSVNARSDYMLRAGEAAQQSDITGSNLAVSSDITSSKLTVTSDITGGGLVVVSDLAEVALTTASKDAVASDVWVETTRALTDKADFALAVGEAAQQSDITGSNLAVSSDITSSLLTVTSDLAEVALTTASKDAIASDVWVETTRALTDKADFALAAGEAAQQSDVAAVATLITGGDLTVVSDITGGNLAVTSDTQNAILAAAGLDSISTTEPAGLAGNFREKMIQVYRRFFGKTTMTSDTLLTYKEDESTTATTQTVADDSTTQTQGEAT